jgi:hypothetical protein
MKVRFAVPLTALVVGKSIESLNFETTFEYKGLLVKVSTQGDEPLHNADLPAGQQDFRMVRSLAFEFEPKGRDTISDLVGRSSEWPHLVNLLIPIANRVLNCIRNFAAAPHVIPIKLRSGDIQSMLARWKVESSTDGSAWHRLVPESPIGEGLAAIFRAGTTDMAQIDASEWRNVREAVQEDLEAGPEREFLINAIELVRADNWRMAIMESVIGLEIVLVRYLTNYMESQRRIPAQRVKAFLNPQLGLTDRIAIILDLTMGERLKGIVNIDEVLTAIRCRNHIVHKTGHLPTDIPEETVRNSINAVLMLTDILATESRQIQMSPTLQILAEEIAQAHKVPKPTIRVLRSHRFLLEFWSVGEAPTPQAMEAVCLDGGKRLKAFDEWFEPEQDLFARFEKFPSKLVAQWAQGKLQVYSGE